MIRAVFYRGSDKADTCSLYQYDYGQVLRIEGLTLPKAAEIHFSFSEKGGNAITRIGMTKDGVTDVTIPDSMLDNHDSIRDYYIHAFVYLRDDTSGETVRRIKIPVTARPKPEAWDKPEDAELFRDAIAAVNASADRAEGAVASAEALVERFDGHVAEKTADAEAAIETVRDAANAAVVEQQEASVQAVVEQQEASVQAVAEAVAQTGGGVKLLWSGVCEGNKGDSYNSIAVQFIIPEECFFHNGQELILMFNGFCSGSDNYGRQLLYDLYMLPMCFGAFDSADTLYPYLHGDFQRDVYKGEQGTGGSGAGGSGWPHYFKIKASVKKVVDSRYAVCNMGNYSYDFCLTSISAIVPA